MTRLLIQFLSNVYLYHLSCVLSQIRRCHSICTCVFSCITRLISMAFPVMNHSLFLLRTTCHGFRYSLARNIYTTIVLNSRIIRKRITRIPADHQVYQHEVDDGAIGPNDLPSLKLVNRNPRNLEQLCLEPKPIGWELESQTKNYWNR